MKDGDSVLHRHDLRSEESAVHRGEHLHRLELIEIDRYPPLVRCGGRDLRTFCCCVDKDGECNHSYRRQQKISAL